MKNLFTYQDRPPFDDFNAWCKRPSACQKTSALADLCDECGRRWEYMHSRWREERGWLSRIASFFRRGGE